MSADETTSRGSDKRRSEDFVNRYANNVFLESSAWDLKFIFGQLELNLEPGKEIIIQHSGIALPWPQVKMLAYLMQVHIAMHEARIGKINVPEGLIYKVKGEMPPDFAEQFTREPEALWSKLRAMYDAFIEENPESE
jgi:uncharacterized protein DUF3467